MGAKARRCADGRRRLLAGAAMAAMVLAPHLAATPVWAEQPGPSAVTVAQLESERSFDIPAQPLTDALVTFGRQSGIQVTVDGALPRNASSPAVRGTMTSEEALARLLAGSGLTFVVADETTIAIERLGLQDDNGPVQLEPITVEGKTESAYGPVDGYLAGRSATATKTDTPIRDIPNSIQVIPQQIIEDQQATTIQEVLENAAGVKFQGNNFSSELNFSIRGFGEAPILRDGLSTYGFFATPTEVEVFNLERAEVLRGPSVLYGQTEPGGAINIVTKKPLDKPTYNFQLQGGNRGLVSPSIDLSGPVTEDGKLLYRLVALYRQEDSFQDYDTSFKRLFAAPSATLRPSRDTDVTVRLEYTKDKDPLVSGIPAFGDGVADIPLDRVMNNPGDTIEQETLIAGYELEHRFNDAWKLRNQFSYVYGSFDSGVFVLPLGSVNEATGILNRLFVNQSLDSDTFATDANVQGKFKTGPFDHTGLIGFDYTRAIQQLDFRAGFSPQFVTPINIFDPDYFAVPTPKAGDIPISFINDIDLWQTGVYVQDQVDLLDNLILVAGLRYDDFRSKVKSAVTGTVTQDIKETAFTRRIGGLYRPIEPVSLYANYSESFVPNTATDASGNVLPPEEGEGFEVGIKIDFIPDQLSSTLAFFDISKKNVATTDPSNSSASVAVGEQRSRGFDADLTGEILPGWNVVAGYAYIDAEVAEDNNPDLVGNELPGVPQHSASLWTTYEIQGGRFKGLGGGIGFNYVGERKGDLANTYKVDSYVVTNAGLFYRWRNVQARLNFDNVFDVNYFSSTGNRAFGGLPGAPFTVRASISATF